MNRSESETSTIAIVVAGVVGLACGTAFLVFPKTDFNDRLNAAASERKKMPTVADVPRAATLSVSRAYSAIPHRRTKFAANQLDGDPKERSYLRVMLATIDQGVALRVSAQRAFAAGKRTDRYIDAYRKLHDFASLLAPPRPLRRYHAAVLDSLEAQRKFLVDWQRQGDRFDSRELTKHPQVRKASAKLIRAYNCLMKQYPTASQQNRDAFFDYHCALDFI